MKKTYVVEGNQKLEGSIPIQGSKNAALAIIVASILCKEKVILKNVPRIKDIQQLLKILRYLHCEIHSNQKELIIDSTNIQYENLQIDEIKSYRASYYFIGAFLSLFGRVEIYQPGGCKIGKRPIDQHIKGLTSLNVNVCLNHDQLMANSSSIEGGEINLDIASVGATINLILASIFAKNKVIINNAAKEPEVVDFVCFLKKMGAKIVGEGSDTIVIMPCEHLHGVKYEIMPDRIVTGTYMIYGVALAKKIKLTNIRSKDNYALINTLINMGVQMDIREDSITIYESNSLIKSHIITGPYPAFPSDLQQVISVLFLQLEGVSIIEETLFENRFTHLQELKKMNAKFFLFIDKALLLKSNFVPATVSAHDLRGGAALLLAALIANGTSIIQNVEYIERGYEDIVRDLNRVGARIHIDEYEEA